MSANQSSLIGYLPAPEKLDNWIRMAGQLGDNSSTELGRRIASFNVKRVASQDITSNSLGVAAIEVPDEGEAANFDFLASSALIFFEFLGLPGEIAYIQCIGFLGEAEDTIPLFQRFTVLAPEHFLIATGDFLKLAEKMRGEGPVQNRAAAGGLAGQQAEQKAQDTGGERIVEGEKMGYYIVTRDGIRLPTRDKKEIQRRCDELEFMWRAVDRGLWRYMAGPSFKLQTAEYWITLVEEAESMIQPAGSVFHRIGKLSLIVGTTMAKDMKLLGAFLKGEFGGEDLGINAFCVGAKLSTSAFPCVLQNAPLAYAVEAIEVAMEVLFSSLFLGSCGQLVDALRGHERPLKLTDSGFLVHSVERVFRRFFRVVSRDDSALGYPGSDITHPGGCAQLLKAMIAEMLTELTDVAKATILEKRYTIMSRIKKERMAALPTTTLPKSKLKSELPERTIKRNITDMCGAHLGHLLKVSKKNGAPLTCPRGSTCKFKHWKLKDFSKEEAKQVIATMPQWMQDCLSGPVHAFKDFKN